MTHALPGSPGAVEAVDVASAVAAFDADAANGGLVVCVMYRKVELRCVDQVVLVTAEEVLAVCYEAR